MTERKKIRNNKIIKAIGKRRWELVIFGGMGIILFIFILIETRSLFQYYFERIEQMHFFNHAQFYALILFGINSIYLFILGFIRKRISPVKEKKIVGKRKLKNPKDFFGLIYGVLGMTISFALIILAISNTHSAIINSDSILIDIEAYHVPLFIISFIQYFIIILLSRNII